MQSQTIPIINKLGLHARAAAKLVTTASKFSSEIHVTHNGQTVNGKSIMGIMMLAAARGSEIQVTASGSDEADALLAIRQLIENRFGEEQ
ncbi:MAG: HPr family phosphocarrier protein [Gammaproteobacteria bacterium]